MAESEKKIDPSAMIDLVDRAVLEMTERVSKLNLTRMESLDLNMNQCSSLTIETSGDYHAKLTMYVENSLLEEITRNMKRGEEPSPEDIIIYTTEYYNILCGFLISHLNSNHKLNSRFGIPRFAADCSKETCKQRNDGVSTFYRCEYGVLQFQGIGLPTNREKNGSTM